VIGATTALFTGLIGIVQNDIKRVVAYSTLSQLGYMTVALGVSAYAGGVYHLMTHAFFKALLFLGAGSVIIAMHHEQDMRYMGGLRRYMPITWITMWIGSLALAGAPGFAGFFSKDAIIEAVGESSRFGSGYAYFCVLAGVFVTALYSFRLLYLTFHGQQRFVVDPAPAHGQHDHAGHAAGHLAHAPQESPWVVTVPLILLAIPSIAVGWPTIGPMLFDGWFGGAIRVRAAHDVLASVGEEFHGPMAMMLHGFAQPPFWLALAGFALATWVYLFRPDIAGRAARALRPIHATLVNKYWFDETYQALFARGGLRLGRGMWRGGDVALIDGIAVNGSANLMVRIAALVRRLQSGYLFHYAFAMIVGLIALLTGLWWFVARTVH
jgi:NADH-quinone oxidoreductase subunit L